MIHPYIFDISGESTFVDVIYNNIILPPKISCNKITFAKLLLQYYNVSWCTSLAGGDTAAGADT